MAGVYGGIQTASIAQGGPKLPDGFHGVVEIVTEVCRPGFHGLCHIAEMVVHESNHPDAPVGFRPSWTANLTKHKNALGNVKAHVGACLGLDPKTQEAQISASVTEQVAEFCVSEKQPLRGKFVEVSTEMIKTGQDKSNDFLLHRWSPTTKTFPSRINDAPVGAPAAPATMQAAPPMMPGAFVLPGMPQAAPSAPSLPGFPPAAASSAPALPGFPPVASPPPLPGLPGMPMQGAAPALPGLPSQPFAPPPMQLPPLPVAAPPPPPVAFPPAGWKAHPQAQGWFYLEADPRQQKTEADLRAGR